VPEYWRLWQDEQVESGGLSDAIARGTVAALEQFGERLVEAKLELNRWDLPGVDVLLRPGVGTGPDDPASRAVQSYAEFPVGGIVVMFGAAAWLDEQGPAPSEPWTRRWCHTLATDEAEWAIAVQDVDDLAHRVQRAFAEVLGLVLSWRWDPEEQRWQGSRINIEPAASFASTDGGQRLV
jgi:hypothetical protein